MRRWTFVFWIGVAYPDEIAANAIRPGIGVNNISDQARDYKRQLDSFTDPYEAIRTLYSLNRQRLILDYIPSYDTNDNPNPTIRAVLFKPVIANFADQAVTRKVRVPATGKKLAYSCWMQPGPAPLVFYIPGLGACRFRPFHAGVCRHDVSAWVFCGGLFESVPEGVYGDRLPPCRFRVTPRRTVTTW